MTEKKKPQAGEWWFSDLYGRVLIEAVSEFDVCLRYNEHRLAVRARKSFSGRHEPDCDSWTWQPPDWVTQDRVPARPGIDERRWVTNGVVFSKWMPTRTGHSAQKRHGDRSNDGKYVLELRCLRKDLPPVQEVWPKYYKPYCINQNAYIKRVSKDAYVVVSLDGTEKSAMKWNDGYDIKLTESEALSRIVKPAEPQPVKVFATVDGILYTAQEKHQPMHTYLGNLVLEERTHGEAG